VSASSPVGTLEDQAGQLENRADQEQAERVEVRHLHLVDDVDGDDDGEKELRCAAHEKVDGRGITMTKPVHEGCSFSSGCGPREGTRRRAGLKF